MVLVTTCQRTLTNLRIVNCMLTAVFPTSRSASQDGEGEWRHLELIGVKQPVQVEVDNSDTEVPAVKPANH